MEKKNNTFVGSKFYNWCGCRVILREENKAILFRKNFCGNDFDSRYFYLV